MPESNTQPNDLQREQLERMFPPDGPSREAEKVVHEAGAAFMTTNRQDCKRCGASLKLSAFPPLKEGDFVSVSQGRRVLHPVFPGEPWKMCEPSSAV